MSKVNPLVTATSIRVSRGLSIERWPCSTQPRSKIKLKPCFAVKAHGDGFQWKRRQATAVQDVLHIGSSLFWCLSLTKKPTTGVTCEGPLHFAHKPKRFSTHSNTHAATTLEESSCFSLIVIIPHLIIFVKRTNKGLYTDVATKSTRAHETHGLFSSSSLSLCPRLSPSGGPVGSEPGLSGGTPVGEGELETGLQELTDVRPLDVVLLLNLGDSQDLSRAVGERVRWAGL